MAPEQDAYEIEVVEGELVVNPHVQLEPAASAQLPLRVVQPAVQTAVAVATGFFAGAATMALLRRYGAPRLEHATAVTPVAEPPRPAQARTYVVHVRQLG